MQVEASVDILLALSAPKRALALHLLQMIDSPEYDAARDAVKATATTLGFNQPAAWKNCLKQTAHRTDWAENQWRHTEAVRRLHAEYGHLKNPQLNGLVELAYQGYAVCPRPTTCRD